MTVYRVELETCFNPRVTAWAVESNACTAVASSVAQLATPWTDGSWWIDYDGKLVGWSDYPPQADVDLANQERAL